MVAWGPDFGGTAGDHPTIGVAAAMPAAAATYVPIGTIVDVAISAAAIRYEPIGAIVGVGTLVGDAVYLAGANAAINDGPDNWTNQGNTTGLRNGVEASRVGQALAATDGNLHLTYANPSGGIELFTISLVQLRMDTRQTGTVANNGGLHHEYRIGAAGAWTSLAIFTGDVSNDPTTYDITAAIAGSWTNVDALEVRVRAVLGLGTNLVTCFCDAVELRIVAARTLAA